MNINYKLHRKTDMLSIIEPAPFFFNCRFQGPG